MTNEKRDLPPEVWLCLGIFLLLSVISAIQILVSRETFFPTLIQNYDLLCFEQRFKFFGSQEFFGSHDHAFNYPAPVALLYRMFYSAPSPVAVYRTLLGLWISAAGFLFVRTARRIAVPVWQTTILVVCFFSLSFPMLLLSFVSNLELVVWIVLTIGVWAFMTDRRWVAAICFGLAGSFKYYPLIYLVLFPLREWRKALLGILTFGMAMLFSIWVLGPTIRSALLGLKAGTTDFALYYVLDWHPSLSAIDHSLFALLKRVIVKFVPAPDHVGSLQVALRLYLPAIAVFLLWIYIVRIRRLSTLSQLMALSVASVWLVPLSHDYTLIHLFAPLAALTFYAIQAKNRGITAGMFMCFGVIFSTLIFVNVHGVRYGGQVRCLTLAVLFILILGRDLKEPVSQLQNTNISAVT